MNPRRYKNLLFLCAALVGFALAAASCSKDGSGDGPSGKTDNLVARVNGTGITKEKLDTNIELIKLEYAAQNRDLPGDAEFSKQVLDSLIASQLLLDYAKDKGYAIDDDTVTQQLTGISSQFGSTEEYQAALKSRGLTEQSLEDEIRSGLTIDRMLTAELASQTAVDDGEVQQFYTDNPQYFQTNESVTASHIIVMVAPTDSEEKKQAAMKKIKAIRQEIVDGADFAEVAREKSEGPSAPDGGSLGTFTRGQMVAPFEEAAFAMKPGELSDIVTTEFGYHIILVENKTPPELVPLDDVKGQIEEYLAAVAKQEETDKFTDGLKAKANIEYFE